ncbi:unnamed protein product [Ambrosiozyma monospora]|uniref:Unnamed protein product n=1 Tax=Ambrosiozyma monospora TaxID=43982 RepID=A0ACB5SSQ3_AMBMO|nr:unnamed protein product [Ambrosiozyma monospora]
MFFGQEFGIKSQQIPPITIVSCLVYVVVWLYLQYQATIYNDTMVSVPQQPAPTMIQTQQGTFSEQFDQECRNFGAFGHPGLRMQCPTHPFFGEGRKHGFGKHHGCGKHGHGKHGFGKKVCPVPPTGATIFGLFSSHGLSQQFSPAHPKGRHGHRHGCHGPQQFGGFEKFSLEESGPKSRKGCHPHRHHHHGHHGRRFHDLNPVGAFGGAEECGPKELGTNPRKGGRHPKHHHHHHPCRPQCQPQPGSQMNQDYANYDWKFQKSRALEMPKSQFTKSGTQSQFSDDSMSTASTLTEKNGEEIELVK